MPINRYAGAAGTAADPTVRRQALQSFLGRPLVGPATSQSPTTSSPAPMARATSVAPSPAPQQAAQSQAPAALGRSAMASPSTTPATASPTTPATANPAPAPSVPSPMARTASSGGHQTDFGQQMRQDIAASTGRPREPMIAAGQKYGQSQLTSPYEDLAQLKQQQADALAAEQQELAATRAKALLGARARMNLAGGALTGQAAALDSDIARTQDRSAIETLANQRVKDRAELRQTEADSMQKLRDQAELWDYEDQYGVDLDHDGVKGAPGQDQSAVGDERRRQEVGDLAAANQSKDLGWGDADTAGGTQEEPYTVSSSELASMKSRGFKFGPATGYVVNGKSYTEFQDQYGNWYFVTDGAQR